MSNATEIIENIAEELQKEFGDKTVAVVSAVLALLSRDRKEADQWLDRWYRQKADRKEEQCLYCRRVCWMDGGTVVHSGDACQTFRDRGDGATRRADEKGWRSWEQGTGENTRFSLLELS